MPETMSAEELREIDARIAVEIMGWTKVNRTTPFGTDPYWEGYPPPTERFNEAGNEVPRFTTDHNEFAEVLAEIDRRGLLLRFVAEVYAAIAGAEGVTGQRVEALADKCGYPDTFCADLLTMSLPFNCAAALKTVEDAAKP